MRLEISDLSKSKFLTTPCVKNRLGTKDNGLRQFLEKCPRNYQGHLSENHHELYINRQVSSVL
jgi:hypothetical protein